MTSTSEDAEILAIKQVIEALDPLDGEARDRVLEYAFKRLGIEQISPKAPPTDGPIEDASQTSVPPQAAKSGPIDIRALRGEKQPSSAVEMAAIVGYYLAEIAPESERKTEIGTAEITQYFKQAQHRLPEAPRKTLPNATAAGYFDSAGRGLYSLNPVGHNLVVHGLPRASSSPAKPRKKRDSTKSKSKLRKSKSKSSTKGKSRRKT